MSSTKIYFHRQVDLKDYTVVSGFPGMALVGKVSVDFLVDALRGQPVAEIYSYGSPSYIAVEDGLGHLPVAKLYVVEDRRIAILTGDYQPLTSELQHEFADKIVGELASRGVSRIITMAAYVTESIRGERKAYVASNDEKLLNELVENGAVPMSEGGVTGLNGLIVGWAKVHGIPAACVMGETTTAYAESTLADYRAAKTALKVVLGLLKLELDLSELDTKAKEIEEEARKIREELVKRMITFTEKGGRPTTYL